MPPTGGYKADEIARLLLAISGDTTEMKSALKSGSEDVKKFTKDVATQNKILERSFDSINKKFGTTSKTIVDGFNQVVAGAAKASVGLGALAVVLQGPIAAGMLQAKDTHLELALVVRDLNDEWKELYNTLFDLVWPGIKKGIEFVTDLVGAFNDLSPASKAVIGDFLQMALKVAAVGGTILGVLGVIKLLVLGFVGVTQVIGGVIIIFKSIAGVLTLILNPAFLALAVAVAAFVYMWNNVPWFKEGVVRLYNAIGDAIGHIAGKIMDLVSSLKNLRGQADVMSLLNQFVGGGRLSIQGGGQKSFTDKVYDFLKRPDNATEMVSDAIREGARKNRPGAVDEGVDAVTGAARGIQDDNTVLMRNKKGVAFRVPPYLVQGRLDKGYTFSPMETILPLKGADDSYPDVLKNVNKLLEQEEKNKTTRDKLFKNWLPFSNMLEGIMIGGPSKESAEDIKERKKAFTMIKEAAASLMKALGSASNEGMFGNYIEQVKAMFAEINELGQVGGEFVGNVRARRQTRADDPRQLHPSMYVRAFQRGILSSVGGNLTKEEQAVAIGEDVGRTLSAGLKQGILTGFKGEVSVFVLMGKAIVDSLVGSFADAMIGTLLGGATGAKSKNLSSFFGGLGGIISGFAGGGQTGGFTGNPNFLHGGGRIVGDTPIVAQDGEGVVSRFGMQAMAEQNLRSLNAGRVGGDSQSVTYVIQAIDASSFVRMLQENKASIHAITGDALMRNAGLRKIMKANL